ncbi:MAG: TetR/AcrR family transcriptional regulator [Melioribacteraceae bacterium]
MTTKEKLIKTTSDLIQTKGYYGTGITEILQISGVPKGSLYHHFPKGKDSLITEALKYAKDLELERYKKATFGKRSANGIFLSITNCLANELVNSNYKKGCPLSTVALEVASSNEEIRIVCSDMFVQMENRLAALLRTLKEPKAAEKAGMFFTLLEGGFLLAKTHRDVKYLTSIILHTKHMLKK